MRRAGFAVRAMGVVAALVLVAVSGCGSGRPREATPVDVAYLSSASTRDQLQFNVIFFKYSLDDANAVENLWALTTPAPGPVDAVWRANGLRVAEADQQAAVAVLKMLRDIETHGQPSRQVILPPRSDFDLLLGPLVSSAGLIYTAGDTTSYADVTNLQLAAKITPMLAGETRISVRPLFYSGEGRGTVTELTGASAVFPFREGGMLLLGAASDVPEKRLGGNLYQSDQQGRYGTLVLIQPRLSD